jgi:allophanate hydrolase subunit 1
LQKQENKKKILLEAFKEHYRSIELLYDYKQLNHKAVQKILKKYENLHSVQIEKNISKKIQSLVIFKSKILPFLINQIETTVQNDFFNGDRKKAKNLVNKKN